MKPRSSTGFRRAVWGSVAFHAVVACALLLLLRGTDERKQGQARIDTRADEPQVRMSLATEVAVEVAPPAKPQASGVKAQPAEPITQPAEATAQPTGPPMAASRMVPQLLPSELVALIRKPAFVLANTQEAVPAGGVPVATPAIHGALNPGHIVVYVLDCSGSMGAGGKFDAARAALLATLRQQPTTVRFQVIVYAGGAKPLLASDGVALPVTEANVRAAAEKLAAMDARGKSNHLEGIRAAVAFRPDVILLLTDADDLNAAALKPALATDQKPVSVCMGLVAASGVERLRALK